MCFVLRKSKEKWNPVVVSFDTESEMHNHKIDCVIVFLLVTKGITTRLIVVSYCISTGTESETHNHKIDCVIGFLPVPVPVP